MEKFKVENNQRDLIKEFGIDKMEEKEQEKILIRIQRIVIQRAISRAIDQLNKNDQKEIEKAMKEDSFDENKILELLKNKIPNFDEIVDQEIDKIRQMSFDIADKIKENEKES